MAAASRRGFVMTKHWIRFALSFLMTTAIAAAQPAPGGAASGIPVGCGGGNFCPDSAITRGQMAVFLSKALGLHRPY
jgi:hypothetical protein